jgi:hypothetical protein
MKKTLSLVPFILLLSVVSTLAADDGTVSYGEYFLDGALRIDIFHVGSCDSERVCIDELKKQPIYAGPKTRLIDGFDLGTYRCELRDAKSKKRIFSRGYCGLFNEWRTTEEARRGVWRALEHSLIVPYPKGPVLLTVGKRSHKEGWITLLEQELTMKERFINSDALLPKLKRKALMVNGEPDKKVDILILGDGYTAREMSKFDKDAKKAFKAIFNEQPFKSRRRDFNVWTVQSPSEESEVDHPRDSEYRRTALGVTFNFFDLPRYSLTGKLHRLFDVAAHAPHDTILLIFNSTRMGGGGIYNLYAVCSADSNVGTEVLIHELGHSLAGLGDEYYDSSVTYIDFYPEGVEPWEPNITALLDPGTLKWKDHVQKGTPVPTPMLPKFRGHVGAFEGAGYKAKGLYRPCYNCAMFSLRTCIYCPVCLEAMNRAIDFHTK